MCTRRGGGGGGATAAAAAMMQRKSEYVNYVPMVLCFGLVFACFEGRKERRVRNWRVDRGENSLLFLCGNIGYIYTLHNYIIH